jgi:saccharopine dehydrogenase-like NADP-dependent oxidoreductase
MSSAAFYPRRRMWKIFSWVTSVPASILSLMLLRDQIKRVGVFPCEVLDKEERDIFFSGIKASDIKIHTQETSEI